jgi:hypothetical protein
MNIFILDTNVQRCAQYHNDRHVVKMILETTQLLNNAFIVADPYYVPVYPITHRNHPCSIWARTSQQNFEWLAELGLSLCEEYTYRYGKTHRCQSILQTLQQSKSRLLLPAIEQTPFAKCMPQQYKVEDAVQSYRNYYCGAKRHLAQWKKRPVPEWWR